MFFEGVFNHLIAKQSQCYTNSTKLTAGLSFNLWWLLIDSVKNSSYSVKRAPLHPVCRWTWRRGSHHLQLSLKPKVSLSLDLNWETMRSGPGFFKFPIYLPWEDLVYLFLIASFDLPNSWNSRSRDMWFMVYHDAWYTKTCAISSAWCLEGIQREFGIFLSPTT